jgi:hypothetical protein
MKKEFQNEIKLQKEILKKERKQRKIAEINFTKSREGFLYIFFYFIIICIYIFILVFIFIYFFLNVIYI